MNENVKKLIRKIVREAYDPTECDQCEGRGATCAECAEDALDEYRANHPEQFKSRQ